MNYMNERFLLSITCEKTEGKRWYSFQRNSCSIQMTDWLKQAKIG